MDLATSPRSRTARAHPKPDQTSARYQAGQSAADEINAYIAVRDSLMEEAKREMTEAAVQRLILANRFVANCLQSTGELYLSQCLPETEAVRERERCQAIDTQIGRLRALLNPA